MNLTENVNLGILKSKGWWPKSGIPSSLKISFVICSGVQFQDFQILLHFYCSPVPLFHSSALFLTSEKKNTSIYQTWITSWDIFGITHLPSILAKFRVQGDWTKVSSRNIGSTAGIRIRTSSITFYEINRYI